MKKMRTLQELTFKSDFMFQAAMLLNPDNCAGIIERATGIPVAQVKVDREKSLIYHPGYKGVRLDVYARDENNTRYDVEMQILEHPGLGKRARYYQSQMDMELLKSGEDYTELPQTIVLFICDFDPFGDGIYRYTFENLCRERGNRKLGDERQAVFLSTCGNNPEEVPETLVRFLAFVRADLNESMKDFGDEFVSRLQESVRDIKKSREMEGHFMLWEEMIRDERKDAKAEGKAESVLELLENLGTVPEDLRQKISSETDLSVLKKYLMLAARVETVEQFAEESLLS